MAKNVRTIQAQAQALTSEARQTAAQAFGDALDARAAFEKTNSPNNENIHKSIAKSRAAMTNPVVAAFLTAANVDAGFVNRELNTGKRYNVYAISKLADLVRALDKGVITNAINNAITRSLFQFRAAGEAFTGEMAKAAASDKIRVSANIQKILVRHDVAASTAPTQSSSTLNALETLGVIENKGSRKFPVYALTDTPATKRLEEICLAA